MLDDNKKLYLSAVTSEFALHRCLLSQDLKRPTLEVAVQEDFAVTDGTTLEKLDDYIRACHGVIHLLGKATGAVAEEYAVARLLALYPDFGSKLPMLAEHLQKPQPGFTYTQWEAYLAIYHERPLFIYLPADLDPASTSNLSLPLVSRGPNFVFNAREEQCQREHYFRICAIGQDRGKFLNEERLSSAVLRDLVEILPQLQPAFYVPPTRLRHNAERLIGRDEDLARLDAAWNDPRKNIFIIRAFGGMGKTSLVATWMAELALKQWRGAERVFDWSFYSQGTNDQSAASAEPFVTAALAEFGDPDPSFGSAWERGARLAHLLGRKRCLLVLDGLEPLQYPPGPVEGKLKDPAIEALLKGLAARNAGLCIVNTREKIPDVRHHYGRTAEDFELTCLSDLAGAALLHDQGAQRARAAKIKIDDPELQKASREVHGHGLTLQLLGQYLRLVEGGDILKRDTVRLADADHEFKNDVTRPYGHAFKTMEAYERWFQREGADGERQLAVLRLLGLFDQPASKACLAALRAEPPIAGLTEALVGLDARAWNGVVTRLQAINLLTQQADESLDTHPLLREYFSHRLRDQQPAAWQAAHLRLYEFLCTSTKDQTQPKLTDLQPLYQAIGHGCLAGKCEDALLVYRRRIHLLFPGREPSAPDWEERYGTTQLGAITTDLGALACFFQSPWTVPLPALHETEKMWILEETANRLRSVGRISEAFECMQAGRDFYLASGNPLDWVLQDFRLCELEAVRGRVTEAAGTSRQLEIDEERSGRLAIIPEMLVLRGWILHQHGKTADALARFKKAEALVARGAPGSTSFNDVLFEIVIAEADAQIFRPESAATPELGAIPVTVDPALVALNILRAKNLRKKKGLTAQQRVILPPDAQPLRPQQDYRLCTVLMTAAESAAWRGYLGRSQPDTLVKDEILATLDEVKERTGRLRKWHIDRSKKFSLRDEALHHLVLVRSALYGTLLDGITAPEPQLSERIEKCVRGLRDASMTILIPLGLLTRAWLRSLPVAGEPTQPRALTGPDSAQSDLDEASEIAEYVSLPFFLADIHLYRARLFFREAAYPWNRHPDGTPRGPADDLKEARDLIEKHGYWRRKEELEDAEAVILPLFP